MTPPIPPDLVVESITVAEDGVTVVIKNEGQAPVVDQFWVDVYIDPTGVPTAVNQIWSDFGSRGLVWGVTDSALPIRQGETVTLQMYDQYYFAGRSTLGGPILPGQPVYAHVDSVALGSTVGGVLEIHEKNGGAYNNISGPASR